MPEPTPRERLITAHAESHGWRVYDRDDLTTVVEYRKRGAGYVRLGFGVNGHVLWAATEARPLVGTAAVMRWMSSH